MGYFVFLYATFDWEALSLLTGEWPKGKKVNQGQEDQKTEKKSNEAWKNTKKAKVHKSGPFRIFHVNWHMAQNEVSPQKVWQSCLRASWSLGLENMWAYSSLVL